MTSITDAPVGVKRVVRGRYSGGKNDEGAPHGVGVLLTDVVFYKGEFVAGKFHGTGFLRRFGPPGSATPNQAPRQPSAGAAPTSAGSASSPQQGAKRPLTASAATLRARPPTAGSPQQPATPNALSSTRPQSPPTPNRDTMLSPPAPPTPKVVSPNGSRVAVWTYIGEFWEGKRHGHGKILFHGTGESFEGDWFHDEIRGRGVYTLPSGVYTGAMHSNRRHGIGTMIYVDGSGYRGHWQQDVIHGAGRLVEPDGTYFDGHWNRGVMNGIFHMTKPSGSVYRRQYLDGRKVSDEKRKGRDLYSKLFEPAPAKLTAEERLAQVFPVKIEASPAELEAAQMPDRVEGVTSDVFSPRLRPRPGSAGMALNVGSPTMGGSSTAAGGRSDDSTELSIAIDYEDLDDDMDTSPTPSSSTALTRRRSTVRPLSELPSDFIPRRPHSAGNRPVSAGGESDEEEGSIPRRPPLGHATSVLESFKTNVFSPNATLVTSDDGASPDGQMTLVTSPNGTNLKVDVMSPRGGELLERFTSALMQEAEKLGDAPVPERQDDESKMSHDEWLEKFHAKRREADLDRRASLVLTRHDTLRRANTLKTPKSMASISVTSEPTGAPLPAPTPLVAAPPTTPRADPAFGPVLGSFVSVPNMSFMERTFTSSETSGSSPQHQGMQDSVPLEATLRLPTALQPAETNYDDDEPYPMPPPSLPSSAAPDHLLQRLAELSQSPPRRENSVRLQPTRSVHFSATAATATTASPNAAPASADTPKYGRRSNSQAVLLPAA